MADIAISKYKCPNCQTELEQEGYISIDVEDPTVTALYNMTLNKVTCPNCSFEHYLSIPLFYHDGGHELLICYMPGVSDMSPTELADNMRVPYERLMLMTAERLNIELPEPDAAAFPIGQEQPL
jgi:DNA-directed RNA polymerase subunit RPC12/RpoP